MQNEAEQVAFGPWSLGLVNNTDEYSVPYEGLLTADDVDIDREGIATTRAKWGQEDGAHYSSVFEHNGITYAVRDSEVGVVGDAQFTSIAAVAGPISWTVLDGAAVYSDYTSIYTIRDAVAYPLDTGFFVDEEEMEYQLAPMPGGSEIHAWRGRLIVVRGNSLIWSEALRYGAYSAARNFIRFGERIFWAVPMSTGIYVGLRNEVVFLAGTDPNQFTIKPVGGESAPGVAALLDTRHSGKGGEELALWFTDVGIAIGRPSGEVSYPQAERLKGLSLLPGKMVVEGDRVYIFTTKEY